MKNIFTVFCLLTASFASTQAMDACDPYKVYKAEIGYVCRAGNVIWKIDGEIYDYSRPYSRGQYSMKPDYAPAVRVYLDTKSGLRVTAPLFRRTDVYEAPTRCRNGFRLPTGYSSDFNGKYKFPNKDSDWVVLEKDNFRQVVPEIGNHWLWSSSFNPTYAYDSFIVDGLTGAISVGNHNVDQFGIVVCVAGP